LRYAADGYRIPCSNTVKQRGGRSTKEYGNAHKLGFFEGNTAQEIYYKKEYRIYLAMKEANRRIERGVAHLGQYNFDWTKKSTTEYQIWRQANCTV
jgi:hypothetical protein